jgi:hypothetical protein
MCIMHKKKYDIYIYIYMKPACGPQTMFFGNDYYGVIVVPIQVGVGKGAYWLLSCSCLFLSHCFPRLMYLGRQPAILDLELLDRNH